MKRCNNCGWFNLNSVTHCEKCDEDSFEIVEEPSEPKEIASENNEPSAEVAEVVKIEGSTATPVNKGLMATIALGVEKTPESLRKNLASTVMDATAVLKSEVPSQCPKCNYPISGYVEYCPNCGYTIRTVTVSTYDKSEDVTSNAKETLASTVMLNEPFVRSGHAPAVTVKDVSLKATVRDIPVEFIHEESPVLYSLEPITGIGESSASLRVGDVVSIEGQRYRIKK